MDTGIVCGSDAGAFDIWDQGTVHQHATRYYDADGNLTRRVNHEHWAPRMVEQPPAPQTSCRTRRPIPPRPSSPRPVTSCSATETTVGENIYRDPITGEKA